MILKNCFSEKAINDAFKHASRLKFEKEKSMEDKLDIKQFKLFLRILRMTYNFYEVSLQLSCSIPCLTIFSRKQAGTFV